MKKISSKILLTAFLFFSTQCWGADVVKVDGSSTVYPITEAVAEEFQIAKKGAINVTVGISGTGGGFKKFCRGETDISNASRPISSSEMEACRGASVKFVELPISYDALTVVVNPGNSWAGTLTMAELKKIWAPESQGVITSWNQVRPTFPNKPLKLYGPGADSGTFDYFTEAVNGKAKSSRGDYTASEDDNTLVQGVASDVNALGYFGYAYYIENQARLKAVSIDGGAGAIAPSRAAVDNGTYPLSRPIFIYVAKGSLAKPAVKEFVRFYLKNAPRLSAEVKYIPLTSALYAASQARLDNLVCGTTFAGAKPGTKIESVMGQSPRL
ncbi:MAG: PstS family phosphate ABC transporter substrate-binding protein [Deltaproteobacteria bacterium]|nr:PstS family phosphate ABC transporter substrate-binding protein [Deltaproteobacteria bacterium]